MVEQVAEQLSGLGDRERRLIQARWEYRQEKIASGEIPPMFAAIVIPSYGMSRWKDGNPYRLSFFSGIVCRAAYEVRKQMLEVIPEFEAPPIVVEGARIFPGDPKNDGDLMSDLLIRLGVSPEAIIQRRDNRNTYDQLLDSKRMLAEREIPQHEAYYIYSDLHKQRIPRLMKNYGMNSHSLIAENYLSDKYPAFADVWAMIKNDPSYHEEAEKPETWMTRALWIDPQGVLARKASEFIFARKGADVPDVRHRQTVRSY